MSQDLAAVTIPSMGFAKTTLTNGLDVIARRQGTLPIVAMNLWYHVGSKNEERQQRGFAHLFEHLMFEGSEHYPGDFFKRLQPLGAAVNGSTSADRTNYYVTLPVAHLDLALAMESDRMGHLLPALTEDKLRIQKDVVKNEFRQNYLNRPYGQVGRVLAEAIYPPTHPYSWQTIGVMEDIDRARREDVEAFFRRYYVPSNASLCVVGDIDEDEVLARAEGAFGDIEGGMRASRPWAPGVGVSADVVLTLRDRVELERTHDVWLTVAQFDPDDAPLSLLGDILGRGRASRLYRKLVVEEGLAQGASAHQSSRELSGTMGVTVTLRPGKARDRARALVLEAVHELAASGPSETELARAIAGRQASFIYALDNVGGFGGVADRLNAYNVYRGDPGLIVTDLQRYERTTAADIQRVAALYLADRPRVVLDVLRREGGRVARWDRSVPPASRAAVAFRAPVPEIRRLRCGAELWVVPRRDLPIVAATAVVLAGSGAHSPSQAGLASLTTAMMDEGTERFTAEALALATEGIGAHLGTECGPDGCYVSLQCLAPRFATALDCAVDVLLRPTFPEREFVRVHAQALASLRAERASAEARAHRGFLRALYGTDHPYGTPVDGDARAVGGLQRADLAAFHREHVVPGRSAWVIAGDVDADALQELLDERLGSWCGERAALPALEAPARGTRPRIQLLHRPGAAQAVVRAGHIGAARDDEDREALLVLNQVLGGQFTSRLNHRLREEKGLTYGVRSHYDLRRGAGPFVIAASLQADRLSEALEALRTELIGLLDDRPPTESELADARRSLIEGQSRHFETPAALVSRYAGLYLHGLPPDEHRRHAERLAAVEVEDVRRAAARHLVPDALEIVIVADAEIVAPGLSSIAWSDFTQVEDADGEAPSGT